MKNPGIKGNANTTLLIASIKKAAKQYGTLSKDEERALIEKYKNNRTTLNQLLVMHNVRAVFNMAKKYKNKTYDFDGLVMDGMRGLSEAATLFDITKGIKFITYAMWWIRKRMTANFYGKQTEVDKRTLSLNAKGMTADNGDGTQLENFVNEYIDPSCSSIKSSRSILSGTEEQKICQHLFEYVENNESLSAQDKAVFKDIYWNQERPKDISLKYNLSTHDINQIKAKVLNVCKDVLVNQYQIKSYHDLHDE